MAIPAIVIDTNVFVAALLSQVGASYKLVTMIDASLFTTHLSVPLAVEYEDAGKRILPETNLRARDLDDILDFVCASAQHHEIYFLWRPTLKDAKDDMVLELAVAAECDFVVTFNKRDFVGAERYGVEVIDPKAFLQNIGVLK
jgi:putative PIN family toxin of toxin-antitoxin system